MLWVKGGDCIVLAQECLNGFNRFIVTVNANCVKRSLIVVSGFLADRTVFENKRPRVRGGVLLTEKWDVY